MKSLSKGLLYLSCSLILFTTLFSNPSMPGQSSIVTGINALPSWSDNVFYINIHKLMNDPLFSKIIAKDRDFQKAQKELSQIGVDMKRDLRSVVVGVSEVNPNSRKPPSLVLIMDLRYDENELLALIKKKAAKKKNRKLITEEINGFTVLSFKEDPKNFKMVLLDGKALLISNIPKMQEVIQLALGRGKSLRKNPKVYSLVQTVKSSNLFWGVLQLTQAAKAFGKKASKNSPLAGVSQQIDDIDAFTFATHSGNRFNMSINTHCKTRLSAQEIAKTYQGVLSMMKLAAEDAPNPVKGVVNKIEVKQAGKLASIKLSVKRRQLQKFIDFINK
ncbi:MAG: hypothetical protein IEMM0008_1057 [bacterium]|nr:MAG: hypothetical protein IEMM0008_1057 [bacterium]